jgi:hypothetical protein
MMKLYTTIDIAPSAKKIGYGDKVLLLGSCFADNIGAKFEEHYFQTTINPYGTLYNPASIAKAVLDMGYGLSGMGLVEHNGLWHSMMHHGSFSHACRAEVVRACEQSRMELREALEQASTVIVTFGTAWVYEYEGEVVSNCHKLPANRFVRRRLTVAEIVEMWQPILAAMSDKHWIFTVSPIRHVKDGLHENQVSKSILLQAVDILISMSHTLSLSSPSSCISYFPSYEIMLDELRDYRFYAEDMVHPSQVAVDYIWQRFVDTYMTVETQNEMRALHQLWRDRHHRMLHPESPEAQQFAAHIKTRLQELQPRYPWIK